MRRSISIKRIANLTLMATMLLPAAAAAVGNDDKPVWEFVLKNGSRKDMAFSGELSDDISRKHYERHFHERLRATNETFADAVLRTKELVADPVMVYKAAATRNQNKIRKLVVQAQVGHVYSARKITIFAYSATNRRIAKLIVCDSGKDPHPQPGLNRPCTKETMQRDLLVALTNLPNEEEVIRNRKSTTINNNYWPRDPMDYYPATTTALEKNLKVEPVSHAGKSSGGSEKQTAGRLD